MERSNNEYLVINEEGKQLFPNSGLTSYSKAQEFIRREGKDYNYKMGIYRGDEVGKY